MAGERAPRQREHVARAVKGGENSATITSRLDSGCGFRGGVLRMWEKNRRRKVAAFDHVERVETGAGVGYRDHVSYSCGVKR